MFCTSQIAHAQLIGSSRANGSHRFKFGFRGMETGPTEESGDSSPDSAVTLHVLLAPFPRDFSKRSNCMFANRYQEDRKGMV